MASAATRDVLSRSSPAGIRTYWQAWSPWSTPMTFQDINWRRGEALMMPVTTSVPTKMTTSVHLCSLTVSVMMETGATPSVYSTAGVFWSTAMTTSVLDPLHCKPIAGGSCENIGGSSSSARITSMHFSPYDSRIVVGGPFPETVRHEPCCQHASLVLVLDRMALIPF